MSKGEAPMGRPIQKKWFGPISSLKSQIIVTGVRFADNTTATNAYILSQTGDTAYMVQDTAKTHAPEIVFMVNANAVAALLPGQCFINATPFGGTALPAKKIQQYRITLFTVPNTVATATGVPSVSPVANYTWSTVPATKTGQANLITDVAGTGIINAVTLGAPGSGYLTAPPITFPAGTGGGSGATATTTVTAGQVSGITLLTGGSGYTAGAAVIGAPAVITATATATVTAGAVTAINVTNGGGYYIANPAVTFTPVSGGTGATGTAVLTAGRVTSITITAPGTGYTVAPTVGIAAPAAGTATATFTVTSIP